MEELIKAEAKLPATQPEFLLIGAVLPRTGSLSLKAALTILLQGKVIHMIDVLQGDITYNEAMHVFGNNATDEEFRDFFLSRGYVSGVDAPFCYHVEQALRTFPNAKVLLSKREFPKWEESVRETILKVDEAYCRFPLNVFMKYIKKTYLCEETPLKEMYSYIRHGEGERFFTEYAEKVRALVPADRLLEFSVKEGWDPLCKFLKVPVPNTPFPRLNDRQNFAKLRWLSVTVPTIMCWTFICVIFAVLAAFVYFII